ncbi:nuclease-related domain-containing protein [Fictibacillus aquaticus]|uniref:NERD domain-containing protein n=1 Tax=Fictibacillus aquaticus TaxID=2021314 RepID=A0A235F5E4_9BACL|nr:nuclease-related domain-containing protein [Fictibacillus aquaticus]OYD56526.1 hypothetical protein CGZ90_16065 [Fictibacillus aquaticus]
MIVKKKTKSIRLMKLEALLRRMGPDHPKRQAVQEEFARHYAGYKGEHSIDYYLRMLLEKENFILYDVRLLSKHGTYFQIDTIIVFAKMIMILEVKNFQGDIFLDSEVDQMVRTRNGVEEGFPNPLSQLNLQHMQLSGWLKLHKFPNVPIESLVVFTNPLSIVRSNSKEQLQKVAKGASLITKIQNCLDRYSTEAFTKKECKKAINYLMKNHTPHNPDIMQTFQIREHEIQKGVQCSACGAFSMIWKVAKWHCIKCPFNSRTAHKETIMDYSLLLKEQFKNRDIRAFISLSSRKTVHRIIHSLSPIIIGSKKGMRYMLSYE